MDIGTLVAGLLTLAVLSFLYRDNPVYKMAEGLSSPASGNADEFLHVPEADRCVRRPRQEGPVTAPVDGNLQEFVIQRPLAMTVIVERVEHFVTVFILFFKIFGTSLKPL